MSDQLTDEAVKLLLSVPVADFDEDGQLVQTLARALLEARAQLADAKAAQAMVVERAAERMDCVSFDPPDHWDAATQNEFHKIIVDECLAWQRAIRALADPSGVEALAALRAERDVLRADRDSAARMWQAAEQEKEAAVARSREASQMLAIETNHATQAEADRDRLAAANAALEAQVEALRVARRDQMEARVEAVIRRNFVAPEDAAVEALCLRFGYGAVMDAAARLWARSDMLGAFYIGGCIGFRTEAEARAALAAVQADARRDGEGGE